MAVQCATTQIVGTYNLVIDGVTVSPTSIQVGQLLTISGYLTNTGTGASLGNHYVKAMAGSVQMGANQGPLAAIPAGGSSAKLTFTGTIGSSTAIGPLSCCLVLV